MSPTDDPAALRLALMHTLMRLNADTYRSVVAAAWASAPEAAAVIAELRAAAVDSVVASTSGPTAPTRGLV